MLHVLPAEISNPAKSTGGAKGKGKISPYNKFMKEELARLKESEPDMRHPERLVTLIYCANQIVTVAFP